ncbi:MAG TPA: transcription termination factor NusA [Thermoanaerobaculia bacterium]|nr:transcription termination factor NusA [Thermoanaerobaculia bacterium]
MFSENVGRDIRALAHEKSIDVEKVFSALEDALATAAKKYYKTREPIETVMDRETGQVEIYVVKEVVGSPEEIEDPNAQLLLEEARKLDPEAEVGSRLRFRHISKTVVDIVDDPLTEIRTYEARKLDKEVEPGDLVQIPLSKPPEELGRIAAQSAKQVLYQKVREAEREKVYREFVGKVGELENGYVKRFERGDMIIDLNGKTEGIIPRSHQSRAERYAQGDRIRAVIVDVHTQPKGPQVVLSRTDPRLLIKLFEMEVPEIYDGTVIIKGAVREPGERAKIAVTSRERDVDPVGACVGVKGSRVQSIIRELRGEKIDIIPWIDDIVGYAQNALAPAKITRVAVTSHEGTRPHLDVIVDNDQLSLAIGKRGLNVRLAAELIGAKIDIKSEEEVKGEVADALTAMLHQAMEQARAQTNVHDIDGMDPDLADVLEAAGYDDLDSILNSSVDDLTAIEGVDPELAAQLIELARDHDLAEVSPTAVDDEYEEGDEDYEEDEEDEAAAGVEASAEDSEPVVPDEQQESAPEAAPVATEDVERS